MELSPRLYRLFVRPPILTRFYFNKNIRSFLCQFDFHNKDVLDFGCGIGSSSFMFQPDYYIGMDCDSKRIEYASHLHPNYRFIASKSNSLSVRNNSVDFILIMAVLHHIPSTLLKDYLKEFRRVLRPKGQVIIIEPCFFQGSAFRNRYMSVFDRGKYIRSENEYLDLFHQQGYMTESVKRFNKCLLYNEVCFTASLKS